MKTLIIKDLARSEQLDRNAMAAVRGGWKMTTTAAHKTGELNFTRAHDVSIEATQDLVQVQKVLNSTANGSAFIHGVKVRNDVAQDGLNLIVG